MGKLLPLSLPFESIAQRQSRFDVCRLLVGEIEKLLNGAYPPIPLFELTAILFLHPLLLLVTPSEPLAA